MKQFILALVMLVLAPVAALAQTNPCSASATGLVANPNYFVMTITDFAAVEGDGTPRTASYELAFYAQGSDPNAGGKPLGAVTAVAKTSLTLTAGTTNCYGAALPTPPVPPAGTNYYVGIRGLGPVRGTTPAVATPWVLSNPFGEPLTYLGPVAPSAVRTGRASQ